MAVLKVTRRHPSHAAGHVVRGEGVEWRAAALAGSQQAMVTSRQLAELGMTRRAIARRVAEGRLHRRHRGVYQLGPLDTPLSGIVAAVLALGDGAVASHRAAGTVWEMLSASAGDVDVTVIRNARPRAGIRVRRARLAPGEATSHRGIPVTTPVRTLLDLATVIPCRELERAVEQAAVLRLPGCAPLDAQFPAAHRGSKLLRAALHHEPALTRSEAERRVLDLVRAARLPSPRTNTRLHGYEVDMVWPAQRLVVEVDGYRFHSSRAAFERDRLRDAELQSRGYKVIRVTWRQITEEPEALIATLARALA